MEEIEEIVTHGIPVGLALGLLGVLGLLLPLALPRWVVRRRRDFWCSTAREGVRVEFEERGLPGFRTSLAVLSCSRFAPTGAIVCDRRCLDPAFRRRGPSALPVGGRPAGGPS